MIKLKSFVSIICSLTIVICNTNVASSATDFDTYEFKTITQKEAQQQYDILMNSFVDESFYNNDEIQVNSNNIRATISESQINYPKTMPVHIMILMIKDCISC